MLANLVYLIALVMLSPMIVFRSIKAGRYRRGLLEKLFGVSAQRARKLLSHQTDSSELVWFHAVSVGEVNLLPNLIHHLEDNTSLSYVISSSTDTGYDLAVERFGTEKVFFCPLDFTWAVKRTLRHLKPSKIALAELELWPNLIRAAKQQQCKVIVINARLSERSSRRYRKFTWLTKSLFGSLDWVGCQDEHVRDQFHLCGTPQSSLEVTGSLKFDNAPNRRDTDGVVTCGNWAGQRKSHRIWLVGSTQSGEEELALSIFLQLMQSEPELRLIIVPRHAERFDEVARVIESMKLIAYRRSNNIHQTRADWPQREVILIDTIGELRQWWGTAEIATVGGTFGSRGGQNMLEPAGYGCAVSFGPDTRNFKQIAEILLQANAAVRVQNQTELHQFVSRCLSDPSYQNRLGEQAKTIVNRHRGAMQRTCRAVI